MIQGHENLDRIHEVAGSSERSFGLVFTAVFGFIGVWPVLQGGALRWWILAVAAAILAIALFRPGLLAHPNRWWMRLGVLLGRVVNPIVLGVLYYFTIVPVGLLMRITGKDPLRLRFEPKSETYWIKREPPGPEPGSLKRQF